MGEEVGPQGAGHGGAQGSLSLEAVAETELDPVTDSVLPKLPPTEIPSS